MIRPAASPARLRALALRAVVAAMAVGAVCAFVASLSWIDRPYPGFKLRIDQAVELQLPPGSTGAQAGLMPGDRVVAVDGRPLRDPRDLYAYVAGKPVGTPVAYDLERALPSGQRVTLHEVIATQRHDARLWASFFLALWLTGLCFLGLGAAVSAVKPGDPRARANLAFHLAGAAACIAIFDQSTTYLFPLQDPYKLLQWLIAVCFANLALQFPRRYPALEPLRRVALWAGLGLSAVLVGAYYLPGAGFWVHVSHLGYVALAELVLLGNALWSMLSPASTPQERGQGQVLLIGTLVSTVPALLVPQAHLVGVTVNLEGFENFAMPLWPLAISYAIARHELFDLGPLVRRSLTYLIAAAVLTALYVASTAATGALIGSHTQLPGIVATVLVAYSFVPVRDRVKAWLDVRFFRSPYRFDEVIAGFTRTAQETVAPQALMQAWLAALDGALAPTYLAIALHRDGPQPTVELGDAEAAPMMRLPLAVQDHRLGHAMIGPKKSALPYTELDRALLSELTQLLAVWLDRLERFEKVRLQAQELEALRRSEVMQGQFLNVVSHELKIPLSVMMSSLNLLQRQEAHHDARTVSHLQRMRRSLTHLVGLVGDLLNAGQLQSGHFALRTRRLDLGPLLADMVAEMRPLAEHKGHALTLDVEAALPAVVADEARLAQVLRNLIHNAIRYTPANGRIVLGASVDGERIRCEVRDDGPGIDETAMPHLFQRFSQVHDEASGRDQGVGLGLFISKAIVEAHGGAIGVESAPGAGSTFWFTLPVPVEPAPPGLPSAASEAR